MTERSFYLAGPDVFLPDAIAILTAKVAMATEYGFKALIPGDDHMQARVAAAAPIPSSAIYAANVATMKQADFGILNLTPFRGISADVGTVFELGLLTGLGKPVFGYTNVAADYLDRIWLKMKQGEGVGLSAKWVDDHACGIENYQNADNLMIDGALGATGGMVREETALPMLFQNLEGFRACLEVAAKHFAATPAPTQEQSPVA
jgi:nucleoside 2-deoxyribosyltransferase